MCSSGQTSNFGTPRRRPMKILNYRLTLWQYRLWGTKLENFLSMNKHTQMKLLKEFVIIGELSKIGHHFSNNFFI